MREQFEFGRGEELEKGQHRKFLTLAREVVEKATASDDVQIIEVRGICYGPVSYIHLCAKLFFPCNSSFAYRKNLQ